MARSYGVDVSHFQSPSAPGGVTYEQIAKRCNFVMVRATYGVWKDPNAVAHVTRARAAGLRVGLYAFFRSTQPITDQLKALESAATDVGLKPGDLAPALDVEDDISTPIAASWQEPVKTMLGGMLSSFAEAIVYVTQRDFGRLGKPDFILERPLWVAHYTPGPLPATPGGKPCVIWQRRVGPFAPDGPGGAFAADGGPVREGHPPGPLDQNVADGDIPHCSRVPTGGAVTSDPAHAPAFTQDELRAMRARTEAWINSLEPDPETPEERAADFRTDEEQ